VKLHNVFQPEALQWASETNWDHDTDKVITSSDLYLDISEDLKDDFDMLEVLGVDTIEQTTPVDVERVQRLFVGDDATSVGSLFMQTAEANLQI
jgi:hypothetical protein